LQDKKIIQCPCPNSKDNNVEVEYAEDWEDDHYYYDKQDWKGLLKLRERYAKLNENDLYAQWRLGEAYILNGEYQKAIEILSNLHIKYPDFLDVQYSILDALFALNKTEKDFKWIERPTVILLDKDILDRCYDYLKNKRKPRTISDLYSGFVMLQGYVRFSEKEIFESLVTDGRFIVDGDGEYTFDTKVKVVLKEKRNRG
jgi:tetratricopeptide (TPR) repeat protein